MHRNKQFGWNMKIIIFEIYFSKTLCNDCLAWSTFSLLWKICLSI